MDAQYIFEIVPKLNVQAWNSQLQLMAKSASAISANFNPIKQSDVDKIFDEVIDESRVARTEFDKFNKTTKKTGEGFNQASKGAASFASSVKSIAGGMLAASGLEAGIGTIVNGVKSMVSAGVEYKASLAELEAITGVSGAALDDFGAKAQSLASSFGGGAVGQIETFKGVLSRLGPAIAESPEGLNRMATAINTMATASGMQASESMDALTNSMLQFNVSLDDPVAAAGEMERMMNVLAAGSKEGASEITQSAQAIVTAGSALSQANQSFEESNAAIQVLAAKSGQYGSQAGTSLRNVIGLLQKNSGEAEKLTKSLGLPFEELGKTLNEDGLGAAMERLKSAMEGLNTPAEKNAALMKIFGTENAGAAAALMNNTEMLADFTAKMTGTNTAIEQSKIQTQTLAAQYEQFTSKLTNTAISAFEEIEPALTTAFSAISESVDYAVEGFSFLADTIADSTPILVAAGSAYAAYTAYTNASAIATKTAAVAQRVFNAAMNANPVGLAVTGIVAAVAAYKAFKSAIEVTAEEKLEEAKAEEKLLETRKENLKTQVTQLETQQDLVKEYEELGSKTNRTAEENKRLQDVINRLNQKYPAVIQSTKSFSDNLSRLKDSASQSAGEIDSLKQEIASLDEQLIKNRRNQISLEVDVAKQSVVEAIEKAYEEQNGAFNLATLFNADEGWANDLFEPIAQRVYSAKNKAELEAIKNDWISIINVSKDSMESVQSMTDETMKQTALYMMSIKKTARPAITDALFEMIDSMEQKITLYSGNIEKLKKEAAEPVQTETTDTNAAKAELENLKSLKDEIVKVERETAAIRADIQTAAIADRRERDLAELDRKLEDERYNAAQDIAETAKLEDVKASEKTALIQAYGKKLKATEEQIASERQAITLKYATEELEAIDDKNAKILDSEIALAEKRLELKQRESQYQNADDYLNNLEAQSAIELSIFDKNHQKRLSQLLTENEEYAKAYNKLIELKASGAGSDVVAEAESNFSKLKSTLLATDPLIQSAIILANQSRLEIEQDYNKKIADARIYTITDLNKVQTELAKAGAQSRYDAEYKQARGNQALQVQAFKSYQLELYEIEQASLAKRNVLYAASMQFRTAFMDSLVFEQKEIDQGAVKSLEDRKNQLNEEYDALITQLKNREISQKEFNDRQRELSRETLDIRRQLDEEYAKSQPGFWSTVNEAAVKAFDSMATSATASLKSKLEETEALQAQALSKQREIADEELAIEQAKKDGMFEIEQKHREKLAELTKEQSKIEESQKQVDEQIWANRATAYGSMLAKMGLEQKNWAKAGILTAIQAAKAEAPIWAAKALMKSIGDFGWPLGPILGGLAAAAVYAAASGLENVVVKGFRKGGKVTGGEQLIRINEEGEEFVSNNRSLRAPGNEQALEWANRTGKSLDEYYASKTKDKFKSLQNVMYREMSHQNSRIDNMQKDLNTMKEMMQMQMQMMSTPLNLESSQNVKITGQLDMSRSALKANFEYDSKRNNRRS